ncbi:hypothetical protein [Sphingomonas kyeonggiensis]|uniref:hypothetical protein n=1 Tax=Sphingomonas kyeonggiensis TaxID=1268553 RepID=UPI001FEB5CD1|nr:hypothetical protein [Sphingomonas kyeonggiensis]
MHLAEGRDEMVVDVAPLVDDVLATRLAEPLKVVGGGLREERVCLAALGKVQAPSTRVRAELLDLAFCLLSTHSFALFTDDAMNALAIDHDVDCVPKIAISESGNFNAMFRQARACGKSLDSTPRKLGELKRHVL